MRAGIEKKISAYGQASVPALVAFRHRNTRAGVEACPYMTFHTIVMAIGVAGRNAITHLHQYLRRTPATTHRTLNAAADAPVPHAVNTG